MFRSIALSLLCFVATNVTNSTLAMESAEEIKRFAGSWQVVELVDNGKVIPPKDIPNVFPSGGRAEIVSNTIQFTSAREPKAAKVFSVDPTVYPKNITIYTLDKPEGWGIYRFEEERLIVCIADPFVSQRPTAFSSREDSHHMMMVLERAQSATPLATPQATAAILPRTNPLQQQLPAPPAQPATRLVDVRQPAAASAAPAPTGTTARVVSDADVTKMLWGSWRMNDGAGVLEISFDSNGTYRSYRDVQDPNSFYRVFVHSPVAAGTWSVKNGNLSFNVKSSTDLGRVNTTQHVAVRSISLQDLIFVDSVGRVGKAVKLP